MINIAGSVGETSSTDGKGFRILNFGASMDSESEKDGGGVRFLAMVC